MHCRTSSSGTDSQFLRPDSYVRPNSAHLMSPNSDIVGPSPVTSNGTETTEIEDDEAVENAEGDQKNARNSVRWLHCAGLVEHWFD